MSVAFRRESDEEHKEPRFELPLPPGPNLVTARGFALIETEVAAREQAVMVETDAQALEAARRALRYWRTRLATAQLVTVPHGQQAAFGTRVSFRLDGQARTIAIVGGDEADPATGSIAFFAPLARALIGAAPGDLADFAGRADAIEVIEVVTLEP